MPTACTKEQAEFAQKIIDILLTSLTKLQRTNNDLTNKLNYLTRVQNNPTEVAKLQAGIGALTNYTINDLLTAKTFLNDICVWLTSQLARVPDQFK